MSIDRDLICVVCPVGCRLKISGTIEDLKVTGEQCKRGIEHAHEEITNPTRMVCTTVKIKGGIHNVIPVRTDKPIPEKYKLEVVKAVENIILTSPIEMGHVVIEDIFGTGVNLITERNM
jgi:CxxC motif-containing protein